MEYNREVSAYFKRKGVSVILLVRRNMLKRLISILANAYDRRMKPLNGTHKSHVHSHEEVISLALYHCVRCSFTKEVNYAFQPSRSTLSVLILDRYLDLLF